MCSGTRPEPASRRSMIYDSSCEPDMVRTSRLFTSFEALCTHTTTSSLPGTAGVLEVEKHSSLELQQESRVTPPQLHTQIKLGVKFDPLSPMRESEMTPSACAKGSDS